MEDTTTQTFKDHVFIATSAWVIIVYAFLQLYYCIYQFLLYQRVLSLQKQMLEDNDYLPSEWAADGMFSLQEQVILLYGGVGIGACLLILSAVGLLRRRKWGRILFTLIVTLLLGALLYLLFFYAKDYVAQALELMNRQGLDINIISGQMRSTIRFQYYASGILALIVAWAIVRVTIKLNSKRIRIHFF